MLAGEWYEHVNVFSGMNGLLRSEDIIFAFLVPEYSHLRKYKPLLHANDSTCSVSNSMKKFSKASEVLIDRLNVVELLKLHSLAHS